MNKIAVFGIVIVLSIAAFATTIVASYGSLKVEAAISDKWCYTTFHSELICFQSKSSCNDAIDYSGGTARPCHQD